MTKLEEHDGCNCEACYQARGNRYVCPVCLTTMEHGSEGFEPCARCEEDFADE